MAILPASQADRARQQRTILRVHGVGGWTSEDTLQTSDAVQVSGDGLSGFYRRPGRIRAGDSYDPQSFVDSEPVVEAYDWGLFSSQLPVQAFWLLLTPFTFVNLAGWMGVRKRPTGRLLRLLGLTLTLEFLLATTGVTVGVLGEQCSTPKLCNKVPSVPLSWLPSPLSSIGLAHPGLPTAFTHRLVVTFLMSVLVLIGLWQLCWTTRRRYERWPRHAASRIGSKDADAGDFRFSHPGSWRGDRRVLRQSLLHTAAAVSLLTWLAGTARQTSWSWLSIAAAAVAGVAAVLLCIDRVVGMQVYAAPHDLDGKRDGRNLTTLACIAVLAGSLGLFVIACVRLWTASVTQINADEARHLFLPGWTGAFVAIAVAQAALWLVLVGVTWGDHRAARTVGPVRDGQSQPAEGWTPFVRGCAPLGASAAGIGLAAVLTAGAVTAAELILVAHRLPGEPQPNTQRFLPRAFVAIDAFAFGFVIIFTVVIAATFVLRVLLASGRLWVQVFATFSGAPGQRPDSSKGVWRAVSWAMAQAMLGMGGRRVWDTRRRFQIWRAYAFAMVSDSLAQGLIIGAIAGFIGGVVAALFNPLQQFVSDRGNAGLATSLLVLLTFGLVWILRGEQRDPNRRRLIGIIWDVATFFPRAAHPFAPPCYAERAVPELVYRLQWLSEGSRTVVLVGYSQGSPITAAALWQMSEAERRNITLVTAGCPLRRLYARAFPLYFGYDQLKDLGAPMPDRPHDIRWINVWRSTDYIGGWIMSSEIPQVGAPAPEIADGCIDQWLSDPRAADPIPGEAAPPVINAHSNYFQDPGVGAQVARLVQQSGYLAGPHQPGAEPGKAAADARATWPIIRARLRPRRRI